MMTEEQMDQFEYDMLMADEEYTEEDEDEFFKALELDNEAKENTMLEKIKYAGEKISEIIQAIAGVVLSFIMIAFVGSIVIGFITLCLGAL